MISTPTPAQKKSKFHLNRCPKYCLKSSASLDHVSVLERDVWISKISTLGFNVKIMICTYPVASKYHSSVSMILNRTIGRAIGYWKGYVSVTNSRLFCEKL